MEETNTILIPRNFSGLLHVLDYMRKCGVHRNVYRKEQDGPIIETNVSVYPYLPHRAYDCTGRVFRIDYRLSVTAYNYVLSATSHFDS